jgi:hypothetical protein
MLKASKSDLQLRLENCSARQSRYVLFMIGRKIYAPGELILVFLMIGGWAMAQQDPIIDPGFGK